MPHSVAEIVNIIAPTVMQQLRVNYRVYPVEYNRVRGQYICFLRNASGITVSFSWTPEQEPEAEADRVRFANSLIENAIRQLQQAEGPRAEMRPSRLWENIPTPTVAKFAGHDGIVSVEFD